jgi:hypothetical protein
MWDIAVGGLAGISGMKARLEDFVAEWPGDLASVIST